MPQRYAERAVTEADLDDGLPRRVPRRTLDNLAVATRRG